MKSIFLSTLLVVLFCAAAFAQPFVQPKATATAPVNFHFLPKMEEGKNLGPQITQGTTVFVYDKIKDKNNGLLLVRDEKTGFTGWVAESLFQQAPTETTVVAVSTFLTDSVGQKVQTQNLRLISPVAQDFFAATIANPDSSVVTDSSLTGNMETELRITRNTRTVRSFPRDLKFPDNTVFKDKLKIVINTESVEVRSKRTINTKWELSYKK